MNIIPNTARKARSATYHYAVTARRDTLALYLAWEYGVGTANRILRDIPKTSREIGVFPHEIRRLVVRRKTP